MAALSLIDGGFSLLAGGLTTLSPCVLPLLPLVVGGAMQRNRYAPWIMASGMVTSFALMGVALGLAGASLDLDPERVRAAGAVLLMLFGVVLLLPGLNGLFTRGLQPLASAANAVADRLNGGSALGVFLLGALPGGLLLGLFGLGAALPLVAVAYLSRSALNRSKGWLLQHGERAKKVFGLVILLAGLAIFSGVDKWLEAHILALMPDSWVSLITRY